MQNKPTLLYAETWSLLVVSGAPTHHLDLPRSSHITGFKKAGFLTWANQSVSALRHLPQMRKSEIRLAHLNANDMRAMTCLYHAVVPVVLLIELLTQSGAGLCSITLKVNSSDLLTWIMS